MLVLEMINNGIIYFFLLFCGFQNCILNGLVVRLSVKNSREAPEKKANGCKKDFILKYFLNALVLLVYSV